MRFKECANRAATAEHGLNDPIVSRHIAKATSFVKHHCIGKEYGVKMAYWIISTIGLIANSNFEVAHEMVSIAKQKAEAIEMGVRRARQMQWREWLKGPAIGANTARAPTKEAFRWVKGIAGWSKSPIGTIQQNEACPSEAVITDEHDETTIDPEDVVHAEARWMHATSKVPLSAQADIEDEANQWASLWCEGQDYLCYFDADELTSTEPLRAHQWRAAALSFPSGTGLGCDNTSPRAYARLSEETLDKLGLLMHACERAGLWAKIIHLIMIVLLAKPDGGRRPIGLFPTMIRVWMRARACVARAWESDNFRPQMYGGLGMSAQRAAWQAAFQAELAAKKLNSYAQALLDLVKAFEKVQHHIVKAAAKKHGYNLTILRLTFAAYRMARVVGVDGVMSRRIIAICGITAGSGTATTELRMLLLDIVDDTFVMWATVTLTVFVDDMSIESTGHHHDVKTNVAGATDFIVRDSRPPSSKCRLKSPLFWLIDSVWRKP